MMRVAKDWGVSIRNSWTLFDSVEQGRLILVWVSQSSEKNWRPCDANSEDLTAVISSKRTVEVATWSQVSQARIA